MAGTYNITRTHLIFGLCLPLAVLLGYMLAEPMQSSSMAILVMVASVLGLPLLMRWYHPMMVFGCNAAFYLGFLPGAPSLWMAMAAAGFFVVVLNRCTDSKRRIMIEGPVAWSLVGLVIVAVVTAELTGGIGMRAMGSSSYGGKHYLTLFEGILVYFVLASQRVPTGRAGWYVGLFYLSGITGLLSNVVYWAGPAFYNLYYVIPAASAAYEALPEYDVEGSAVVRITGWTALAGSICFYLLVRYGVKAILDLTRPWRLALVFLAAGVGLFGGFRSFAVGLGLTVAIVFFLEGLHRTRYLVGVLLLGLICGTGLVAFSERLPWPVQRALSFLPIDVDPMVKQNAEASSNWRLEMWRELYPLVPQYLLKGKGYGMDPKALGMALQTGSSGYEWAMVSGDYHSGPLSVLITFGLWGALAFGAFLFASTRSLYNYYRYGDPALRTINLGLLACFISKIIFFLFVFGGLESDMVGFAGMIGLAVSLNGETQELASVESLEPSLEMEAAPAEG